MNEWAPVILILSLAAMTIQINKAIQDLGKEIRQDMKDLRFELRQEIRTHTHEL